jgi:hypothetical protein
MLNRDAIFARHPWLAPDGQPHAIVIGDDLDAALSALLYLSHHPNARIVGVYVDYTRVQYAAGLAWPDVLGAVWLDLDIYARESRSLGHHIVRLSKDDALPGFATSCNLNELAGRSVEYAYQTKYPLGTVHFLMWLYKVDAPAAEDAEALVWLADSAYINGQAHRFRRNVGYWLKSSMPLPALLAAFARIDTPAFEEQMSRLQRELSAAGFQEGPGQARSRHLQLGGYQCQPPPGAQAGAHMLKLIDFAARVTGWAHRPEQVGALATLSPQRRGARNTAGVPEVRQAGLDRFLGEREVFSFVFPNADRINYTAALTDHAR